MEQQIQFATASDGVSICYATSGSGPPVVKAGNWLSHLEFDLGSPVWRHMWEELSRDHLLVRYDQRGCGLSDWDVQDLSYEARTKDLESVVAATGIGRFALLGMEPASSPDKIRAGWARARRGPAPHPRRCDS